MLLKLSAFALLMVAAGLLFAGGYAPAEIGADLTGLGFVAVLLGGVALIGSISLLQRSQLLAVES